MEYRPFLIDKHIQNFYPSPREQIEDMEEACRTCKNQFTHICTICDEPGTMWEEKANWMIICVVEYEGADIENFGTDEKEARKQLEYYKRNCNSDVTYYLIEGKIREEVETNWVKRG